MSTEKIQKTEETATIEQWERRLGFEIMSYDGFRNNSKTDRITEKQFRDGLVHCTQNIMSVGWQLERAKSDYAFLSVETERLYGELASVTAERDALARQVEELSKDKFVIRRRADGDGWTALYNGVAIAGGSLTCCSHAIANHAITSAMKDKNNE